MAVKEQVRELFLRMYAGTEVGTSGTATPSGHGYAVNGSANGNLDKKLRNGIVVSEKANEASNGIARRSGLNELAEEFTSHIPDATYTPAEIQNHLMRYKKEPWTAVEKVDDWIEEMTIEKRKLEAADEQNESVEEGEEED